MHRFMKLERGPWGRGRGLRGRKSWSTCDVKVGRGTTRRHNGTDKKGPGKLGEESCHRKAHFMLIYKERTNIKKVQQVENRFLPQSYWNGGIPSFLLQSPQKPEHSQSPASLKPCVHHPPFLLSCHAPRLSGLGAFSWWGTIVVRGGASLSHRECLSARTEDSTLPSERNVSQASLTMNRIILRTFVSEQQSRNTPNSNSPLKKKTVIVVCLLKLTTGILTS